MTPTVSALKAMEKVLASYCPSITFQITPGTSVPESKEALGAALNPNLSQSGSTITVEQLDNVDQASIYAVHQTLYFLQEETRVTALLSKGGYIDYSGAQKIATFLKINHSLQVLDVRDSGIDEDDLLTIITSLEFNTSLQCINLSGNKVTDAVLKAILTLLQTKNSSLKQILVTEANPKQKEVLDSTLLNAINQQLISNAKNTNAQAKIAKETSMIAQGMRSPQTFFSKIPQSLSTKIGVGVLKFFSKDLNETQLSQSLHAHFTKSACQPKVNAQTLMLPRVHQRPSKGSRGK